MCLNQVHDVDNKTSDTIKKTEEKAVLLLESGIHLHITDFQWPKNPTHSGFSMKV